MSHISGDHRIRRIELDPSVVELGGIRRVDVDRDGVVVRGIGRVVRQQFPYFRFLVKRLPD